MSLKDSLKKSLFSLLVAGFVLVSINISGAQVLSSIPGCGNLDIGSVKIAPFVQVGYKNIGLNFNLPFTIIPFNWDRPPALDLKFRDAGVWVGSIGFDASLLSTFFFSLRGDANASKNINVITYENDPWYGTLPYTWRGSQLQWWDIDGMVGYAFLRDWSVVAGLRYDKLTVGLRDPLDATGRPYVFANEINALNGDLILKTWIPYIGLQLNATNYKALLIYSPLASPDVINYQRQSSVWTDFPHSDADEDKYKFANTGSFLEGSFEYNVSPREALQIGLWARGTWMKFKGNGNFNSNGVINEAGVVTTELSSQDATGSLSRYDIGGGLAASFSF